MRRAYNLAGTFSMSSSLDFVQSWLEAIRYKGVAIYLFFNTFSMSSLDPTLKKCPSYVILHMTHICGMYKVELLAVRLKN